MKLRKVLGAAALAFASQVALATPSVYFLVDGNTFSQPFSFINKSSNNERITRFQLDLAPANMVFDTVDDGPPFNGSAGTPLTPRLNSDVMTGLLPGGNPADGASVLDLNFSDFDANESFTWDIDVDGASGFPIAVFGNDLIGAVATIDFSDGQRLRGILRGLAGSPQAAQFEATGLIPTPTLPEPGSLALAGLALLGLGLARRRQRS